MVDAGSIGGIVDKGNALSGITGKGGGVISNLVSGMSEYISNMGAVEWVLLFILGIGGFVVWYLKKKYNLKFGWAPKKRKTSFN